MENQRNSLRSKPLRSDENETLFILKNESLFTVFITFGIPDCFVFFFKSNSNFWKTKFSRILCTTIF